MKLNWAELIQERGKLSRTGLTFLVWMTFLMTMIGVVTFRVKESKLPDVPESYVYITLVLCGTYTARRFLSDKYGKDDKDTVVVPPPPVVTPPPVVAPPPIFSNPPPANPPMQTFP